LEVLYLADIRNRQTMSVPCFRKPAGMGVYIILVLALLLAVFPAAARAEHSDNVRDYMDYLGLDEVIEVQSEIDRVSSLVGLDIAIVITDDTQGKSSRDFADDYYDDNGFGMGSDYSGTLLLIDMNIRMAYMSTCGHAIDVFTNERIDNLLDAVTLHLADGDYYQACLEFVSQVERYGLMGVPQGQHREPDVEYPGDGQYNGEDDYSNLPREQNSSVSPGYWGKAVRLMASPAVYLIAAIIALIAAVIASAGHKGSVTVNNRTYGQSFTLTGKQDDFINQTINRVRIADSNNNKGGHNSSNTSSVHTSSSGRSHGGGGRSF